MLQICNKVLQDTQSNEEYSNSVGFTLSKSMQRLKYQIVQDTVFWRKVTCWRTRNRLWTLKKAKRFLRG